MKAFQELTEWSTGSSTPNHIYFLSDGKDKMFAYIKSGTNEVFEFKKPYSFSSRGRKFKEVHNVWGFFPRGELVKASNQFKVAGSKGNEYTVTEDSGKWSCTCPGFTYRGSCKHIKELA